MPKLKLTDRNRRKMIEVKRRCPCITISTLAYAFDISPSRAGEIIRAADLSNNGYIKRRSK